MKDGIVEELGEVKHKYILIGPKRRKNPASLSKNRVPVAICGETIYFNSNEKYSIEQISFYLKKIHAGIFTEQVIQKVTLPLGKDYISGNKVVELFRKVDGMITLSSTTARRKLENILSAPFSKIERFLEACDGKKYLHTLDGLNEPYLLRRELVQLQSILLDM